MRKFQCSNGSLWQAYGTFSNVLGAATTFTKQRPCVEGQQVMRAPTNSNLQISLWVTGHKVIQCVSLIRY